MIQHEKAMPTPFGTVFGRDAVYDDHASLQRGVGSLRLTCKLPTAATTLDTDIPSDIPFTLIVNGIVALRVTDIDYYAGPMVSNFAEAAQSPWLMELGSLPRFGELAPNARHLFVLEYDLAIEIIATSYELSLDAPASTRDG